jgi:hypothetical protein
MGEMSGWSCARKVIAHIMYMAAAESTSVDRQTLKQEPVSKALDCLQPLPSPFSDIYRSEAIWYD